MKHRILVADDAAECRLLIVEVLSSAGYSTIPAETGEQALRAANTLLPDLILLDVKLPDLTGIEICKALRCDAKTRCLPVIMVSALDKEMNKSSGYESGADDYITKPFSNKLLLHKVKALLCRVELDKFGNADFIEKSGIKLLPESNEVIIDEKQAPLCRKEFEILYCLMRRPGVVFKRDFLLDTLWYEKEINSRSLDTSICSLKKKLGKKGKFINTVKGVGYKFKIPD